LFELSTALDENGQQDEAVELFQRAFELSPGACNGLPNPGPNAGAERGRQLRARANALIANGMMYSPVIAALAVGEALCGNESVVRSLVDYDRFFRYYTLETPAGFSDFNTALAEEIRSGLKFYDEPRDRSIRKGWRNDETTQSTLPASAALTSAFRREVEAYITSLPGCPGHPFLDSQPSSFRVGGWAVVSDGSSYHKTHIHPEAWASGVYYVVRPKVSLEPGTARGWMTVGPPEWDHASATALPGWESRLVEPEPGTLVLMPGYFFHHTRPMGVDEERICVAFDVIPVR
jgi:hypothetical protein